MKTLTCDFALARAGIAGAAVALAALAGCYDVADASHRVTAVGDTVDVERALYDNSIGAAQLSSVWRDPDFESSQEAFYYARVVEIPTPRWSTFDAHAMGVPAPEPATLQERAITSAIWYRPERGSGVEPLDRVRVLRLPSD